MVDKREKQSNSLRDALNENIERANADLQKIIKKTVGKPPQKSHTNNMLNKFSASKAGQALDSFTNNIAKKEGLYTGPSISSAANTARDAVYNRRGEAHMAAEGLEPKNYGESIADVTNALDGTDASNKRIGLKFEGKEELEAMILHNTEAGNKDKNHRALDPDILVADAQKAVLQATGLRLSEDELRTASTGLSDEARHARDAHIRDIKMVDYATAHSTERMLGRHPEKEVAEMLSLTEGLDSQAYVPRASDAIRRPSNDQKQIAMLSAEQDIVAAEVAAMQEELKAHQETQQLLVTETFENPDEVKAALGARSKEELADTIENTPKNDMLRRALTGLDSREMMNNKIPELVMAAEPQAYGTTKESLDETTLNTNAAAIADMNLHSKAMEADLAYLEEKLAQYDCHITAPGTSDRKIAAYAHQQAQKAVNATAYKDNDRDFDFTSRVKQKQEEKFDVLAEAARVEASKKGLHNEHVIEKLEHELNVEKLRGTLHDAHVVEKEAHDAFKDSLHDAHVTAKEENEEKTANGVEIEDNNTHIINKDEQQVQKGEKSMGVAEENFEALEADATTLQEVGDFHVTVEEVEAAHIEMSEGPTIKIVEEIEDITIAEAPSTAGIEVEEVAVEEIVMEGGAAQTPSDVQQHYADKVERAEFEGDKQGLSADDAVVMPETATHDTLADVTAAAIAAEQVELGQGREEPTLGDMNVHDDRDTR